MLFCEGFPDSNRHKLLYTGMRERVGDIFLPCPSARTDVSEQHSTLSRGLSCLHLTLPDCAPQVLLYQRANVPENQSSRALAKKTSTKPPDAPSLLTIECDKASALVEI